MQLLIQIFCLYICQKVMYTDSRHSSLSILIRISRLSVLTIIMTEQTQGRLCQLSRSAFEITKHYPTPKKTSPAPAQDKPIIRLSLILSPRKNLFCNYTQCFLTLYLVPIPIPIFQQDKMGTFLFNFFLYIHVFFK